MLLTLTFNVGMDYFYRCTACGKKTETLASERPLPQFFPDLRIFFLDQPAACTLIGIDELTNLCFRLCPEHHMDMVDIMIPLFQSNPMLGSCVLKNSLCAAGNVIINHFPAVFYHHDQMIIQQIY